MPYDPGLEDRIHSILGRTCAFVEKKMFGGVAYMVNGRMCCGVVKSDLMLRLGPAGVEAALARPHTRPMDFTGKPMKSMVYVEPAAIDRDDALEEWLVSAVRFAQQEPAAAKRRR